jgi:hypothetical protein
MYHDPQPTLFFYPPLRRLIVFGGKGRGRVVDVVASPQYKRLVNTSFKIDPDLLKELDEFAKERGMERSEVIRRAIAWYLEAYNRPSVTQRITIYNAGTVNRNKSNNDAISTPRIRIR